MPYSNYFDNPYLNEVFDSTPDYSLTSFFDNDSFFEQPVTPVEMSSAVPSKSLRPNSTLPVTGTSTNSSQQLAQTFNPIELEPFDQPPGAFFTHHTGAHVVASEPACFSPTTTTISQTSSFCDDATQQASPSLSPHMLKRESPSSPASESESSTPKRPTRKRGRPKMDRRSTDSQLVTSPSAKSQRTKRLPHNQVERKYREGLNAELERLRNAVPILRQRDEPGHMAQPKPSKAMILASAIEYIQSIEKENELLKGENERLRCQSRGGMEGNWERRDGSLEFFKHV
ncbi:HLH domain containing protein [Pyrenophora tritici-repentis]|uniref:HLH domain containing protein n=2 Tax=Pyrenophora tritici-repentis TaxID=45151 RepID=A0A2W1F2X5_9PLEO|nr:uncharacterized protein PTRG_06180 [Pyrenophora tritici-repentis Pt-1C-BFP]KAA8619313.1 HLH domain-containing protein [Pyrenophora tritici-repentis]EDU49100.1 conserved hypothetical protein [Pyrenophora tritici-repentis Pt-1C-BFP]KAF7449785.1 HLH domain containing protein [Pyrenophora tritici-repentis]KAF7570088.1 HLH domain containing protein [Pyrenophora tritici-repentis]KAG9383286.1 HLH domain containing protein [Pyrenophora tritici-repentis]